MRRLGNSGASATTETDAVTKMETVGLYDVTNVSTICPMVSENGSLSIANEESWKLKWTSNERYLVLASCTDLTVFSLGETAEYYFTTSLGGTITDFNILGDSCFLVVVVDRSKIFTLSLEKQEVYYNEPSEFAIDFVRSKVADDVCFLTFGSYSGQIHYTLLHGDVAESKETNRIENWQTNQIVEFFTKAFTKTTSRTLNMKNVSSPVISVSNGPVQSWTSVNQEKGLMWCSFNSEDFITIEGDRRWVQVRDTGRYALCLSKDGFIHVFDPLTLMFCHKFDVNCGKAKKATVIDFIVIDHHVFEVPTLFAIVVKINEKTEMMIYDRQKNESCFSISCAPQTVLFGYSGSDRMLMSVEECTNEDNDPSKSSIVIRQVSQSRPEMRFEALLKGHRFEEAEKFAILYKLDVQKVYKRRVSYLMDRCDNDDDVFADLTKTLDLITDHNMVADTYFSLVEMSTRFDRIHTYLCNAKKRKITDMDVLKQIENAAYILATYRIIIGPNSRSTELTNRIWDLFVDALHGVDRWVKLYMEFLSISAITEARVIWSRHGTTLSGHILLENQADVASRLDRLFQIFVDAFSSDIDCWSGVIEHVTVDLFQDCLDVSDLLVPRVENLVKNLIRLLEYRDMTNWPDNAIKVSSCFDNMTQMLSDSCVTPSDQSFLALKGRVLCVPDDQKSTPLLRMKKLHHVLHDIKRLKEVYGCSISHSTYLTLSSEEICHKILQNALYNPNTIHAEIEKNVKPFMAERHLNQDQTIFNYIQIMSGGSKMNVNPIIGWEKQCVHLCASLSDESKRCQSIISIASSAKLPWPSVLEESVSKILNSRSLSRAEIDEMLIVCRKTELTRLLSSYGYDRSFINLFTDDDAMIDIVLVIRCVLAQVEKPARFVDCIKILELFTFVQKTDWRQAVNVEYARAQAVIQMMRTGEMTISIINYINDLEEQEREIVTDLVVSFIKSVSDTPASLSNMFDREALLNIGEELLSYTTQRNKVGNENYRHLHKKLILIRELQLEEKSAVLLSDFENDVWKNSQLRKMRKSGKQLKELLTKCIYIGIDYESLVGAILGKAINSQDVRTMLDVFIESVESVGPWVPASKELVDLICELLGWIIYRLPNLSPDTTDMEKAEDIAIVVGKLIKGIRTMIAVFPFEIISDEFDFLMQIEAYLHLCERIIKQSLRGQDTEPMREQSSNRNDLDCLLASTKPSSGLRIYGFARRQGIFDYSSDPALFEGVSGVLAIANVAPSVARPFDSEINEDLAHDYRGSWEQLTMFLAMHSQDLLDISARVYASSLRCFSGEWRQSIVEIGQSVLTVTERMLQQDKFDAWHAATLLGGLPLDQIQQKVSELRISNGAKRNTQSQLNFLQLAFFMAIVTEKEEMLQVIMSSYEQKYLMKRLAKEGIRASIGQSQDVIDKIISQAAELTTPLQPDRLYDYVKKIVDKFMRNHSVSVSEYMIRYASLLIRKASSFGNSGDSQRRCIAIDKYLDLASSALFMIDEDKYEVACNYLSCLLYTVCPYNYEVVQFISHKIKLHANTNHYVEFCQNLQNIMNFLWLYKRTNHMTREESVWFTKRERALMLHEKDHEKYLSRMSDPFGHQLRACYEGSTDQMSETIGSDSSYPADAMVYEKNDVIISEIPPLSSKRIPFHVFLMRKTQDIDDIVMPIVKAELSIYNVPIWQAALRNVSWLTSRFSRTQLLSSAIFSHANKFATVEKVLPEGDKNVIFQLLDSTANRSVVISTIALLFKKIMLSDVKIDLLQMGVNMAERWVQTENIEPPIKNEEREVIVEQCYRLKDGIAKFFTELSLKKNGLYNESTADSIENVEELCTLIYDDMVDWTNTTDVDEKCTIVENIANANGLNLTQLHEKLLYGWVDDSSTNANYEQLDMNDSVGENSYMDRQVDDTQIKDDMTRLPLFDKNVEKMTFLSRRIEKKSLLKKLASVIIKSGTSDISKYNAVARATCILLRTSTDEELATLNENASHFWICENLENQMYLRLHDMTNMKIQTEVEKVQLIRTLLQCPSRTPMMTSLIACLMVDFEYKDFKNIEQIMARLQIAKQWNVLKALLSYARNQKLDTMIRSFPLLWFKVYENALTEINGGSMINKQWNNSQCVSLRKWSLWAMGCNVEGGRQTGVSRLLRELSCPVSTAISSVLSNFTVDQMDDVPMSCMDPKRDLPMMWAKMVPSTTPSIKMEN